MRTIAIINQKGGCGKTTTAINLGACLGKAGCRTLLVDLDPQGHCAAGLGVPEHRIEIDSSDLLQSAGARHLDENRLLWHAAKNFFLIPSRIRLAGLESPGAAFGRREGRERALECALLPLAEQFDVCLIDCPPSIGLLTFNALVAADLVLVPVETGYFSLQGAARQLTTVRAVGRRLSTDIRCVVLPTLHEPGLSVAEDLLEELHSRFGKRLLPVTIHRDTALREAASFGRPVCQHAPNSPGSRDYTQLAALLTTREDLSAGGTDDDWSDVEAADKMPLPRPSSQADPEDTNPRTAPQPSRNDYLIADHTGPTLATSTHVTMPAIGEVVVTLENSVVQPELAHRVQDTPPTPTLPPTLPPTPKPAPTHRPTRSEEIAQRTASRSLQHITRPTCQTQTSAREPHHTKPNYGSHATQTGGEFSQPAALGKRISVAGAFSNWQPLEMKLDPGTNTHALRLPLPAGKYEYRLVVDGHWIADPYNTDWTLNEFGEPHSIVVAQDRNAPQHNADHS